MPNYKIVLEYVGSRYAGWQVQPSLPTVQGELTGRLRRLFDDENLIVAGAARTDAGVHALGQVASFRSERVWEPGRLRVALNRILPPDIGALEVALVAEEFHARRSALGRAYRYQIADGGYVSPFLAPFACAFRSRLDEVAMDEGARHLLGTHDFSSFRGAGDVSATRVKTLSRSRVVRESDRLVYSVQGSSFLQHMVRAIAGSLIEVGRGRKPPAWMAEVLSARDRSAAGATAPAQGLFLERVLYEGSA